MIKEQLNGLIMEAMKEGLKNRTEALRAVKTAFMNWETAKENVGKTLTNEVEFSIIKKLVEQYEDTAVQCNDGKHDAIVEEAKTRASILKDYLPAPATEEDIEQAFFSLNREIEPIKKNMGVFIKRIKEQLPTADGKLVADVVKSKLQ